MASLASQNSTKKIPLRLAVVIILFVCLMNSPALSSASQLTGRGASPTSSLTVIRRMAGTTPCTYEIYAVSGKTSMQNCANGVISFSSTNAAAVINDAISNMTNGGTLFIKAGTYAISAQITLESDVTLAGEGNATILLQAASANIALIYGNAVSDVVVRDLTLDGNRANQGTLGTGPLGDGQGTWMLRLDNSYRPQVTNVLFRNGYSYGYVCSQCTEPTFTNNILLNVEEDAVDFWSNTVGGLIEGNTIDGASDMAIGIMQGAARTRIIGNYIYNINHNLNPYPGGAPVSAHICISFQPGSANITDTTLTGNILSGCPGGGIENQLSAYYVVRTTSSDNHILNVGYAMELRYFDQFSSTNDVIDTTGTNLNNAAVFSSNSLHLTFTTDTFSYIPTDAFNLQNPLVQILGSTFSHIGGHSIVSYGAANCHDWLIQGNTFDHQDSDIIYLDGSSHFTISNNTFDENASHHGVNVYANNDHLLIQGNTFSFGGPSIGNSANSYITIIGNIIGAQ